MSMTRSESGRLGAASALASIMKARLDRIVAYASDPVRCTHCSRPLPYHKRSLKFCDHSCAATFNNLRKVGKRVCQRCGGALKRCSKQYCSNHCSARARSEHLTREWLAGNLAGGSWYGVASYVREWVVQRDGDRCHLCGWDKINPTTGACPVHVDHIDGDPYNHRPENLRLLCPCCHSLTPTFGNLNRGRGRKERSKQRAERGDSIVKL